MVQIRNTTWFLILLAALGCKTSPDPVSTPPEESAAEKEEPRSGKREIPVPESIAPKVETPAARPEPASEEEDEELSRRTEEERLRIEKNLAEDLNLRIPWDESVAFHIRLTTRRMDRYLNIGRIIEIEITNNGEKAVPLGENVLFFFVVDRMILPRITRMYEFSFGEPLTPKESRKYEYGICFKNPGKIF